MKTFTFLVQGSASEPYKVIFSKSEDNLTATCTCPAGENGMYCKHRFRILNGLTEGIISDNLKEVVNVNAWVSGSDVEKAIIELQEAEEDFEKAKRRVSALKKKLSRVLSN